jgi:hypothetical protein
MIFTVWPFLLACFLPQSSSSSSSSSFSAPMHVSGISRSVLSITALSIPTALTKGRGRERRRGRERLGEAASGYGTTTRARSRPNFGIWVNQGQRLELYAHHPMTLRSRKNFPLNVCGASVASHTAVSAPSSTDRVALAPPISVRTHPGHIA